MTGQNWGWYFSSDDECFDGPYTSRDIAISLARENYGEESAFFITEARQGPLRAAIFDDMAERFDDANYDLSDPDGDPPSTEISFKSWENLSAKLNEVATAWAAENGRTRRAGDWWRGMIEIGKLFHEPETRREMREEIDRLRKESWKRTAVLPGALDRAYRAGIERAAEIAHRHYRGGADQHSGNHYYGCDVAHVIRSEAQKGQPK